MEQELARRFRVLLDGCLGCGEVTAEPTCPRCAGPRDLAGAGQPGEVGPLGRLVRPWLPPGRPGVVVSADHAEYSLLRPDGVVPAPRRRCLTVRVPAGAERVRSAAGALVAAATGLDLPEPVRRELLRRAASDHSAPRAFAADCAALGRPDLLADAVSPLSDSERTWWRALALWRAGDRPDAVEALLELPAGRYPQRLPLWWRAATSDAVPDPVRPKVVAAAGELAATGPAAAVAAGLLLRELGERTGAGADAPLVAAAATLGGEYARRWLAGQRGDHPAARLLGAWSGLDRLGTDPAILDAAPPAVLDDLLDRGQLPPSWFDRPGQLRCGDYLWARTRIAALDEAALVAVGAHDERARRAVAAGAPLPGDLPPAVAQRFSCLIAAIGGDEAALVPVVAAAGLPAGALSAALADPAGLPPGALLADESLAARLLARSTADPAAWPAEDLDHHQRGFAARLALRKARRLLYTGDWPAALAAARDALRFASIRPQHRSAAPLRPQEQRQPERLRAEARNLIAAAQWQLGEDAAATAALATAVAGTPTPALRVNFALVAGAVTPGRGAAQLLALAREPAELPLRVAAVRRAVLGWKAGPDWRQGVPLPAELAAAVRALVVAPVGYDAFHELVELLAHHDRPWLAAPGALAGSPHWDSRAARVWTALARDPEELVRELSDGLREAPERWLEELADRLVRDTTEQLNTPGSGGDWRFGELLLDRDLPMSVPRRAMLVALTVDGLLGALGVGGPEPPRKALGWLERAVADAGGLPEPAREAVLESLRARFAALIAAHLAARQALLSEGYAQYEAVRAQLRALPHHRLSQLTVRMATRAGEELCIETRMLLDRLRPHAPPALAVAIDRLKERYRQLLRSFRQLHGFVPGT
jgi:hypothetical protein